MQAIETLMAGRTTFIIAHRLSTVRRCDCILVLGDGKIAEQGTFSDLVRRGGIFAEYYRTQFAPEHAPEHGGKHAGEHAGDSGLEVPA
jgi:ABC-type multidrug transport system fused ATPase/permease subunit